MSLPKLLQQALLHIMAMGVLNWMPDKPYLKLRYWTIMGRSLNLRNPQTFTEKLQWLKIHDRNAIYTTMVDKYAAKGYVASRIGEKYINQTYGVWNKFDDINFDSLPNQFILKCTHDSGGIVICCDKNKFDQVSAKEKLSKSMKRKYFLYGREWPYKDVKPQIIAEEYISDDSYCEGLSDYKVWCFNGRPVYIQYITGRDNERAEEAFYNLNWEKQKFFYHNHLLDYDIPKPLCLNTLLKLGEILAEGTYFSRIDFYVLKGNEIRFGEITFYPMSGMEHFHPDSVDNKFGNLIKLPIDCRM